MSRASSSGRIYVHQRDTNDVPLLGEGIDIGDEYETNLHETIKLGMDDKTRRNYRNRILEMAKYWESAHPQYYEIGTHEVSEDDLKNPSLFFMGNTNMI